MAVSAGPAAISAITRRKFIPKLVDNIQTSNALLMRIPKETLDGGDDIRQPVWYAFSSTGGWYSGSEGLNTATEDKKTALVFDWKQLYYNISITGLDKLKNAGDSKVIDHVKSEIQIAEGSAKRDFGTGLYSAGTLPKSIIGARVFVATSSTYGGISQSSESWLQAQVDATTTVLSLGKMQERWEAATEDNDTPTIITTTGTLFNSYWAKLQPQQRFADGDLGKGGFKSLLFNGAPIVVDSYCPSGFMYFFNEKYLILYSHSQRNFPGSFKDFVEDTDADVMLAKIYWMGALICSQPRKQAAMTALTS